MSLIALPPHQIIPLSPVECGSTTRADVVIADDVQAMPTMSQDSEGTEEMEADDDDASSTTSSQDQDHEPFPIFEPKVAALCYDLWPGFNAEELKVVHMSGGSYHRIVGVEFEDSRSSAKTWLFQEFNKFSSINPKHVVENVRPFFDFIITAKFVIRIPWKDILAWMEHEIAIVKYVKTQTKIPVPDIEFFDLSYDNKIGQRYMVQHWVPGSSGWVAYPRLNHAQKLCVAQQLGDILCEMGKKGYDCPGILDPDYYFQQRDKPTMVRFDMPARNSIEAFMNPVWRDKEAPSTQQSTLEMMKYLFSGQHGVDVAHNRQDFEPWKPYEQIAIFMNDMGIFSDPKYYLTHMDFEPRNIMIDIKNESTARIEAILDWDSAVFAPVFMNWKPPRWLWNWTDEPDENEDARNIIPMNRQEWEIKRAFEDAVGHTYCVYAYHPLYRMARTMIRHGIQGIHNQEGITACEEVVKEWNELFPEKAVGSVWNFADLDAEEDEKAAKENQDSDQNSEDGDGEPKKIDEELEHRDAHEDGADKSSEVVKDIAETES